MPELLNLPEVQSALAPFVVAVVAGFIAGKARIAPAGVGVVAGFIAAALLVNGFQFQPLTAARKIILIGVVAAIVGAIADSRIVSARAHTALFIALALAAAAWVFGIALLRLEGFDRYLAGAGIAAYVAWMVYAMQALRAHALRASGAATALGLCSGVAAIIGSSALFGQLALAAGAAAAGVALALLLSRTDDGGSVLTLTAAVIASFIGVAVAAYAELNWYALGPMSLVPVVARIVPVPVGRSRWIQATVIMISTLAIGSIAAAVAWYSADGSSGGY
jgi:hypothetical protein